ncbi:tRNA guanosine(34) transglycosylase Tgt [Candidatus Peregrinibacteria bacterium]|nr:tRNA guanosine(34) transglycosylase Tgt [bacterium]NCQ56104.1 tRNA guanosine(34) transglycosylase Tgt [Candidatus Parcubacteria bacterium]NCS67924.1 tRNA guanosine(34) transglycosylase Tgt [Candidatus Peregrinibacteria bacterium]
MNKNFDLKSTSGSARAGVLKTRRGEIQTPFFMSVATRAAIKAGVGMEDLEAIKAPVVLCNTYHLHLKPGEDLVERMGGLHGFMKCDKPMLTDSGGFQVFSIKRKKITDDGVWFNSHIDGKRIWIDAERSIDIQHKLGADMIMAFDECPPSKLKNQAEPPIDPAELKGWKRRQERKLYFKIKTAVERTTAWAKRSIEAHAAKYDLALSPTERPQLFGIVQGGCFKDLRERSLKEITALPFDGFAMGGLAVGEPNEAMYKVLDEIADKLPADKPRYLMGVGSPKDLIEAVGRGIDMFDCVFPARNARHGTAYTWNGELRITNVEFEASKEVLDKHCACPVCQNGQGYARAYLRHLMNVDEELGKRFMTIHNLAFYHDLMRTMRKEILADNFENWKKETLEKL